MKFYALLEIHGRAQSYSHRLSCFVRNSERDIFSEAAKSLLDVADINKRCGFNAQWQGLVENPSWYVHKWTSPALYTERRKPYVYMHEGYSEYRAFLNLKDAEAHYRAVATELSSVGQEYEATLHLAYCEDEIIDDPDYRLTLGRGGGVLRERL